MLLCKRSGELSDAGDVLQRVRHHLLLLKGHACCLLRQRSALKDLLWEHLLEGRLELHHVLLHVRCHLAGHYHRVLRATLENV